MRLSGWVQCFWEEVLGTRGSAHCTNLPLRAQVSCLKYIYICHMANNVLNPCLCWKNWVRGKDEFGRSLWTDLQFLVYSNFQALPPLVNTVFQTKCFCENQNHLNRPMKKQCVHFPLITDPNTSLSLEQKKKREESWYQGQFLLWVVL